jgi:hypothetical protein
MQHFSCIGLSDPVSFYIECECLASLDSGLLAQDALVLR